MASNSRPPELRIKVNRTDSVPVNIPVRLSTTMVKEQLTDGPPEIRVTLRNEADETRTYLTSGNRVFGGVESVNDGNRILLLPVGFNIQHTNYRPTKDELVFDTKLVRNTLSPGEQNEITYTIWDHPNNTGDRYTTGTYRFEDEYQLEEKGESFVWGFDLRVSQ